MSLEPGSSRRAPGTRLRWSTPWEEQGIEAQIQPVGRSTDMPALQRREQLSQGKAIIYRLTPPTIDLDEMLSVALPADSAGI